VAYYDHRHSGIDGTNILQVVKAVEGETMKLLKYLNKIMVTVVVTLKKR
jgi:hypothetical protein